MILTKERIFKFLGNKKFWSGKNVTVVIYTDGSNIDIVSPELTGVPKYKYYRDVTAEVSKWVQGKLLKDKLVDKLSDIAANCVKKWNLNKQDVKSKQDSNKNAENDLSSKSSGFGKSGNNEKGMERREKNIGEFSHLPMLMQMRTIKNVAKKYNIKISDVKITILRDPDLLRLEITGRAEKNWIFLFPNAFKSEELLARTLYHEYEHVLQYREYGVAYVQENRQWFEIQAYEKENKRFDKRRG